jgi:hypothetical protein
MNWLQTQDHANPEANIRLRLGPQDSRGGADHLVPASDAALLQHDF